MGLSSFVTNKQLDETTPVKVLTCDKSRQRYCDILFTGYNRHYNFIFASKSVCSGHWQVLKILLFFALRVT
jgi:hypothetical protein